VEDSLVSTIGLVSGIAVAGANNKSVVLTGTVLVFVEAFSMGVGSLLSENSAEEYAGKKEVALSRDLGYASVMFISYLVAGMLIVLPYFFTSGSLAIWFSIGIAITGLFILGVWSSKIAKVHWLRRSVTMAVLGGSTILLGILVGQLVNRFA
jgi:VIT1/CCC1 family predicted Fe2+/Mn2+ transporter